MVRKDSSSLVFFVPGIPAAKGSMNVLPIRRRNGKLGVGIVQSNRLLEWQAAVRMAASKARPWRTPWAGPVAVEIEFFFPRPQSHYRRCQGKMVLREKVPACVSRRPDIDKLTRAVLDAITGVLIEDDARVVELWAIKLYANDGEDIGAVIRVTFKNS